MVQSLQGTGWWGNVGLTPYPLFSGSVIMAAFQPVMDRTGKGKGPFPSSAMAAVECTSATAEQVGFNLPDDPAKDTVILELVNIRDMVKPQQVQQHDGQNNLTIQPALGTELFTGQVAKDFPVGKDLQERQGTGKGGRVLDGGKFGLDRKGFFNYHDVNPLGWLKCCRDDSTKMPSSQGSNGFFICFYRRSGQILSPILIS